MKTSWYWHKNSHVEQCNRIEDLNTIPHIYEHLIFDKKNQKQNQKPHTREKTASSTNGDEQSA